MFKKTKTKEYISYHNGKIVTLDTEVKEVLIPPDGGSSSSDTANEASSNEDFTTEAPKVLNSFWEKITQGDTRKAIFIFAFIICFALFGVSLFQLFKSDSKSSQSPVVIASSQSTPTQSIVSPAQTSANPKTSTNSQKISASPLKNGLDTVSETTQSMLVTTSNEMDAVNNYLKNQANAIATRNTVEGALDKQKKLLTDLQVNNKAFEALGLTALYQATSERLLNSIATTNNLSPIIDKTQTDVLAKILNDFSLKDLQLKETQNRELLVVLQQNNIPYTIDTEKQEILYQLK